MGTSIGKAVRTKASGARRSGSDRAMARASEAGTVSQHGAVAGAGRSPAGAPVRTMAGVNIITYAPDKGVIVFAERVARATPMETVEIERKGVSGRYLKDLAKQLGIATTRVFNIIDMPRATAASKAAKGEPVAGHSGQAALALTRLVALANMIVAESTAPEADGFDAAKWLGTWIERPQPALGGRKPADLLDTPTGADIVTRLLGSVVSGAYQ